MSSTQTCSKVCLLTLLAINLGIPGSGAAVTLNFDATLTDGTCTLNLDKSALHLGNVSLSQLRSGQLVAAQPFTLSVRNCTGTSGGSQIPQIQITGSGVSQDNKWLFRNAGSADHTGILVIQSDNLPAYNQPEIQDGSILPLAAAGKIPADQSLTFYAGVSCGGATGCATVGTGNVNAALMFTFAYQ